MQFNLHNYKKSCKITLAPRECLVILDIPKMKRKPNCQYLQCNKNVTTESF